MAEARCLDPVPRTMDRAAFVARYGDVYEHSPWIAETLFLRGLGAAEDTAAGLANSMAAVLEKADEAAKLALIRAHPDLASRAAIAGNLTSSSQSEQAGAGLDRCTPDEFARFQALNNAYRRKFGFPFILAVAGRDRHAILAAFENRIGNKPATEFRIALAEVDTIARLRLLALAGN